MRRLISILSLVALAGCADPKPPTGFGVNLTVESGGLDAATRASIASAVLSVSGEDTPYSKTVDIVKPLRDGEARFRYVPGIHSGTLSFQLDVADGNGTTLSSGQAGPVTIVDGQAVAVTITLGAVSQQDMALPPDMTVLPQGKQCSTNSECLSGFCADGYCCDTKCDGTCSACNVAGKEGTCTPVAVGNAPAAGHGDCSPTDASTCGNDGKCDGAGMCRKWPNTTQCKASTCDSGTNKYTPPSTCDGKGVCVTPTAQTCAPYLCKDTTQCWPSCTASTQCSSPNTCTANSCGPKSNGADCQTGTECASGKCVDGVCCNSDCTGSCQTCNQATARGTCTVVPKGQDPRNMCPAGTGNDANCTPGGCDGTQNACLTAPANSPCGGACVGGVPTNYTCNLSGKCANSTAGNGGAACSIANCVVCSAGATSASCSSAGTDGMVCKSGSCTTASTALHQATCLSGVCGAQQTQDCGLYSCYASGTDALCHTYCGGGLGGYCGSNCGLCGLSCPTPDSFCAPNHTCATSTCLGATAGSCNGRYACQ